MRLPQLKNHILIMYIMYIINHASLALEPPKLTNILFFPEFEILFSTAQLEGGGAKMGAQSSFAGGVKQNFRALNAQHHPFSIPVYTPD